MQKKGFTLVELLIVVGILAVLATVVVLVLNPAQLFAQARDARRVEDLNSIRGALNLYLTTVSSPDLDGGTHTICGAWAGASNASATTFSSTTVTSSISGVFTVGGVGWVPVNQASTTGGSPLATLPRDPTNSTTYNYQYLCDNTNKTFELNAEMESSRYAQSGADDVESTDGGNAASLYEVGNDPGLNL